MNGHVGAPDYAGKLEAFRKSDAERDALVAEVIENYEKLRVWTPVCCADYSTLTSTQIAYQKKCDDFSNEVESRRLWQSKASTFDRALTEMKQVSFQDYLWAQGKAGGSDAAHMLNAEIKNQLKATYPEAPVEDWQIMVQVVLNLQGLATTLSKCGLVTNATDALEFTRNFSLAQPLFSIIDVGAGKERADHKIRETLRLFMPLAQCKHVFFGPTHDNGYLPVLERYKRDYASRLTLIETRPAERGFHNLGLVLVKFPQIFRSEDLVPRNIYESVASPPPQLPVRTQSMQPSSAVFVPKSPSPTPSNEPAGSSWATVGKNSAMKNVDIAPKKATAPSNRRFMLFNVNDERVDEMLPAPDNMARSRFENRMREHAKNRREAGMAKCCNEWHLGGSCSKGDSYCDYVHGPRLTPGELLVLKHKAKSLICPYGANCDDITCYRGHHCNRLGKNCTLGSDCYFYNTHGMDMKPAKKVYEDGTEEWLQSFLNGN